MTNHPGLPDSLLDAAEVLGVRVALKLMQHFGGQDLYIPKAPGPTHPIFVALGEEDCRAICSLFGSQLIYIPHGRARRSIRSDVDVLASKGHDRAQIARLLGVSQRHVRRVASKAAQGRSGGRSNDGRQADLFGDV